jgi:acetyl-CoA carboxylase carboxyltransferase component
LDKDTFIETDMLSPTGPPGLGMEKSHPLPTDGVVTGWGKVDGRTVYVFAQDFTVMGGSLGEAHGRKIAKLMDLAYQNGAPLIGLNDSGGARIQEGVDSLAAYGEIFFRNTRASGRHPADFGHPWPVRGWGGLFARHHRFCLYERAQCLYVYHRARSDPSGDA